MSRTLRSPRIALVASPCQAAAGRPGASGRLPRGGGLQLTRAADYAVRALVHLAAQPEGTRLSQGEVAAAIDAPAAFVGKVLQQLVAAGLLASQRGIGGGFTLGPAAPASSMLDAVEAIDGPMALNSCLSPDSPCARARLCPAHLVWRDAQLRVAEVLRAATIAALAARAREAVVATGVGVAAEAPPAVEGPRESPRRRARAGSRAEDGPVRPRGREAPGPGPRSRTTPCLG